MADGLLSLSWNNHKATFCHILSTLRDKERYTDVTLACDGKFYPVHKLVLSTCSEYFESMFEQTPCKHPIIVLKDIKSDEVESLLSYMYAGVVNVAQNDLARLIKAAELLKVKGLAVPDEPPQESEPKKVHAPPWSSRDDRSSPHPKRRRRDEPEQNLVESHLSNSPQSSPRTSPYRPTSDFNPDNTRTSGDTQGSESRVDRTLDRSEHESRTEQKNDIRSDHQSAKQTSPHQVVLDETLVKEEIVEPLESSQDDLLNSGMDYSSMTSDTRLENSTNEGGGHDHNQMQPNKFEQSLVSSQPSHLPEAVVEALAGPSGMQGWLGGSDMGGGFGGVESYGEGRHQDLRQPLPGQQPQPQPHQMVEVSQVGAKVSSGGASGLVRGLGSKRKHQCPYCPYTTYFNTNYKRHVFTHTGEKPYACPHCSYRSNSNNHLKRHLSTHSRGKPYACKSCPYQSFRKSAVDNHELVHHGYMAHPSTNSN